MRLAESGMGRRGGRYYLLTVSAPSQSPHRKFVPGRRGDHGPCHCWVEDLGLWNARAGKAWNVLRGALVRRWPGAQFFRAVEVQDGKRRPDGVGRGALHLHVLVWSPSPMPMSDVQALVLAAGFGCVMDMQLVSGSAADVVGYVTKTLAGYVTKACDSRHEVEWHVVDSETGELLPPYLSRPTYRTWSSSSDWGVTMAEICAVLHEAAFASRSHRRRLEEFVATVGAGEFDGAGDDPG